jgi:hypothetical protein
MARHKRNRKGQFTGFGRKHRRHARKGFKGFGRRRGHRRSRKGFGALPGLNDLKSNANGMDVLMGVGVGLLGAAGARWLMNKLNSSGTLAIDTNGIIYQGSPLIGAVLGGAIGMSWKKGEAKSTGWLIGAVASGLAIVGYEQVMPRVAPSLFGYSGVLTPDFNGIAMPDRFSAMSGDPLDQLALSDGLSGADADDIEALLSN